jgi:thymidylate kinase
MKESDELTPFSHLRDLEGDISESSLISVVTALNREKISYCYWKSVRRVDLAMSGRADLDLLVARSDQHRMQQILIQHDFKLFPSIYASNHPAIFSFIGFNPASGALLHIHLHTELATGEPLLRNYRIPWEDAVLARAQSHPTYAVRVLDPACEALLLVVRTCLELQPIDPVALRSRREKAQRFELDRRSLVRFLDRSELRQTAASLCGTELSGQLADAVFNDERLEDQSPLHRRVKAYLAPYRTYNTVEARLRAVGRAAIWAFGHANGSLLYLPRPWNRRAPGGGSVIAVVGVDGSGKSTVTKAMAAWLRPEVDVMPVYFGTGAGRPSMVLRPLKWIAPAVSRLIKHKSRGSSHGNSSDRHLGMAYTLLLTGWALAVALDKRKKLVQARRAANRGLIVIADRYPQSEIPAYNDGPLLQHLNGVPRLVRRLEARAYELAHRMPPDLVIKLKVTPETAAKREPDMNPTVIRQRVLDLDQLKFPGGHIVDVDAERPLADVIHTVKCAVWRRL